MNQEIKKCYERELAYLSNELDKCKKELSQNNDTRYTFGTESKKEESPSLERYNKLVNTYMKMLSAYNEYCNR